MIVSRGKTLQRSRPWLSSVSAETRSLARAGAGL